MHRSTGLVLAVACAFCVAAGVSAQNDVTPAGFRILRGVVLHDDASRQPVRRARVSAAWTDGRSEVFSDDRGVFELGVRAAGGFTLEVSKPGYAPLKEFQNGSSQSIEVSLVRGAVITGTVVDPGGAPAAGVGIVVRRTDESGTSYSSGEYRTDTDDRGDFRVGSLPAGPYAVVVTGPSVIPCALYTTSCTDVQVRAGWTTGIVLNAPVKPETLVRTRAGEELSVGRVYDPPPLSNEVEFFVTGFNDGFLAARGAGANATGSTAAIAGRVLDAFARPVPRAIVRAFPIAGGGGPVASADARGRFELRGLAAGTYRVVARITQPRGLEVPTDARSPTVTVSNGDRATGIDVVVPAGSVIAGKVVDEYGEPLEGVIVEAWQSRWARGRTSFERVGGVVPRRTSDRGEYRLYGLAPGSYVPVIAAPNESGHTPDGAILERPGESNLLRYVFHPGAFATKDAQFVDVEEGRPALAADIRVPSARFAHVRGRVVNSSGVPATALLTLAPSARGGAHVGPSRTLTVSGDGSFHFSDVPPGDYVLRALVTGARDTPRPVDEVAPEFEFRFVTVMNEDVEDLTLHAFPGATVKGRVVVEGDPLARAPAGAMLAAVSADPDFSINTSRPRTSSIADLAAVLADPDSNGPRSRTGSVAENVFQIVGIAGPVRFALSPPIPGWRVSSVSINGINAAEEPVTFGRDQASISDVEVVLSKDDGEISGRVTDQQVGRAGAAVLVFSTDPHRWFESSPFLRLTGTDRDGRFTAGQLTPAEYFVVAVDTTIVGSGDDWKNPELLSRLAANGRRVTVGKGGRFTVDLRLAPR